MTMSYTPTLKNPQLGTSKRALIQTDRSADTL